MIPPKVLTEPIIEPSSPPATVIAPVADEDSRHGGFLPLGSRGRHTRPLKAEQLPIIREFAVERLHELLEERLFVFEVLSELPRVQYNGG